MTTKKSQAVSTYQSVAASREAEVGIPLKTLFLSTTSAHIKCFVFLFRFHCRGWQKMKVEATGAHMFDLRASFIKVRMMQLTFLLKLLRRTKR